MGQNLYDEREMANKQESEKPNEFDVYDIYDIGQRFWPIFKCKTFKAVRDGGTEFLHAKSEYSQQPLYP